MRHEAEIILKVTLDRHYTALNCALQLLTDSVHGILSILLQNEISVSSSLSFNLSDEIVQLLLPLGYSYYVTVQYYFLVSLFLTESCFFILFSFWKVSFISVMRLRTLGCTFLSLQQLLPHIVKLLHLFYFGIFKIFSFL